MPILELTIVGKLPAARRRGLAARLADAAGHALGTRPGGTWVLVSHLPREDYAESDGGPPKGVLPVFARVMQRVTPRGLELSRLTVALTEAIADCCGRPAANVHVRHEAAGEGRAAFGGKLLE